MVWKTDPFFFFFQKAYFQGRTGFYFGSTPPAPRMRVYSSPQDDMKHFLPQDSQPKPSFAIEILGGGGTWRIIPVSKWLVTTIYKPFRPFGRGTTLLRGLRITMVVNHVSKSWEPILYLEDGLPGLGYVVRKPHV